MAIFMGLCVWDKDGHVVLPRFRGDICVSREHKLFVERMNNFTLLRQIFFL